MPHHSMNYRIIVRGHIHSETLTQFDTLHIAHDHSGNTCLTCTAFDQPALHGLLRRIRDTGLTLLSINHFESTGTN